ncbi:MAG: ADP-ribosylglycohydrolase family protein [Segniliparus sp.]|uniref:ADP-ribosylglycohydrolase family protein n=1 Tax=Segniliparus sp. TaxID=2804064 RepID=UPI003F34EEAD
MTSYADRVRGCLVFGAVGDALGAQVELLRWPQIQERFGPRGVADLAPDSPFTDDTQMALFTVEGLIRSHVRGRSRGVSSPVGTTQRAYWRWWWTQQEHGGEPPGHVDLTGWLVHDRRLHARRGPGKTCLAALSTGKHGAVAKPINDSKGSGAAMRAAPVGLVFHPLFHSDEAAAYETGCEIGALTHGHPDGWGPAGALAHLVSLLVQEVPLAEAAARTAEISKGNTSRLLRTAVGLAARRQIGAETIERELGSGWTGDEALAIAVACALGLDDPKEALLASANHSGDSDSTGSICGNILGALHGMGALGASEHGSSALGDWPRRLRDVDLVCAVAEDLVLEMANPPLEGTAGIFYEHEVPRWWWLRYPGN